MADLVTVTGRFELPDNAPATGSLMWVLEPSDIPDDSEPVTVMEGPVRASLDDTGTFTVTLRATDDPDLLEHVAGELSYRVVRTVNGTSQCYRVAVPLPGPWDWWQLSPLPADSNTIVKPVPGPEGPKGDKGDPGQWTQLTQAAYNALNPPDPAVLYVIVG